MKSPANGAARSGPQTRSIVIGTAGHIDHGKTALVYALTGTDTDRLPEEKQRGITIDLGYASLRLDDGQGTTVDFSLIDVPGHHAFIRNMLAGTGGIDCVLLVIAADEGVKAQTEEHLAICSLLGIRTGLVALTKIDAVSAEHLEQTRSEVASFLKDTFLSDSPVLPVSARSGSGLSELKEALLQISERIPQRSAAFIPRLPIDRAFSVRGFGTVVTGTLQAGAVHVGESLEQHPAGRGLRVRGVQVHGKQVECAQAPCRVALNLSGVEVAQAMRGDTLVPPETLSPASAIDVEIAMLPGAAPLKHRGRVRVHAFASESLATLLWYRPDAMGGQGRMLARLRLAKPMLLIPGDRFVLRQCSPAMTVGGGQVLDAHPLPSLRKALAHAWLDAVAKASEPEQLRLRVARRGGSGISIRDLTAETGWTGESIRQRVQPLLSAEQVLASAPQGARWFATEAVQQAEKIILATLEPSSAGLRRAELHTKTRLETEIFELALQRLSRQQQAEAVGEIVRVKGRADAVTEQKQRQLQRIEDLYVKAGLAAPLSDDVAAQLGIAPRDMRELITLLLRSKRLVRMGADNAFVHPQPLEKLYSEMRKYRGETFDVGRFKDFTGLTRKHAIPLLEHLDQERVTRNAGGTRVVL